MRLVGAPNPLYGWTKMSLNTKYRMSLLTKNLIFQIHHYFEIKILSWSFPPPPISYYKQLPSHDYNLTQNTIHRCSNKVLSKQWRLSSSMPSHGALSSYSPSLPWLRFQLRLLMLKLTTMNLLYVFIPTCFFWIEQNCFKASFIFLSFL